MPLAALDHLVLAAETLQQGEDYIESRLGARPVRGGKHVAMGTHNSVLRVSERNYFEIIAIDPEGATPARPRWFELDSPTMRAALREAPRLIHWVARTNDIGAAARACPVSLGVVHHMQRGPFEWRMTIPDNGHLPGRGLVPTLIQWVSAAHPAEAMPATHLHIITLAGEHPEPDVVRAAIVALDLSSTIKTSYAPTPRLAAMIRTPRGTVTL